MTFAMSCGESLYEETDVAEKHRRTQTAVKECSSGRKPTKYDDFLFSGNFEERLNKAGQVSGILEEMGESRKKFLDSIDFVELFPTLYFHTTKLEFYKVLANKTEYPVIKLDMILRFYDAYKMNRKLFDKGGVDSVEPHWKNYYQKASEINYKDRDKKTIDVATEILLDGIDAHVYDISRFVRDFVANKTKQEALLKKEFDSIDSVFVKSADQTNSDIVKALNINASESEHNLYKSGAAYIIFARKKAWEMGVSKKPLFAKNRQPKFEHASDSRAFFPKELMEIGICRKSKG